MSLVWFFCSSIRLKRIIVDPGLYLSEKNPMFYVSQKRQLPNAFRLFSGMWVCLFSFFLVLFRLLLIGFSHISIFSF